MQWMVRKNHALESSGRAECQRKLRAALAQPHLGAVPKTDADATIEVAEQTGQDIFCQFGTGVAGCIAISITVCHFTKLLPWRVRAFLIKPTRANIAAKFRI